MPRYYGYKKDVDNGGQDWHAANRLPMAALLPKSKSLINMEPDIWDQETLGSCTAHGTLRVYAIERVAQQLPPLGLSRLFTYGMGRQISGDFANDDGAQIRDVVKGLAHNGSPREELWPYLVDKFNVTPSDEAFLDGMAHAVKAYVRLNNSVLNQLKSCLVGLRAFAFGFEVPESFEGDEMEETGVFQLPKAGWSPVGGHCVTGIGYDDAYKPAGWSTPGGVECTNSWGDKWGQGGHFWVPYSFITSGACSDFWNFTSVGYGPAQ